jgi:hypothetical protein
MSEKFTQEPQTAEEWLLESFREKFHRRFLWIHHNRRELFDEVVTEIGEKKGVQNLFAFFTSDDPDTVRYAAKLGVSLDALTSQEFISKEELFASGPTEIEL